ncbi:hypothetical protein D3C74_26470 [compost metagenome]
MKKKLFSALLVTTSLILAAVPVSANTFGQNASGGWSETEGYYVNNVSSAKDSIVLFGNGGPPASRPEVHRATKQTRAESSTMYERVHAYTAWENKYHYTQARYESVLSGNIEADSGRVYGRDVTNAYSGWVDNFAGWLVAHTYWGS